LESLYKYRSPKAAKTDCRRRGAITYKKTNKQIRKCSLSKCAKMKLRGEVRTCPEL
jgi:hypothetical protein